MERTRARVARVRRRDLGDRARDALRGHVGRRLRSRRRAAAGGRSRLVRECARRADRSRTSVTCLPIARSRASSTDCDVRHARRRRSGDRRLRPVRRARRLRRRRARVQAGRPLRQEVRVRVLGLGALEYALLAPAACVVAIQLLADGHSPSLGLTLPWAIAVPLGFIAALWAVEKRDALRVHPGRRRHLAEALDSIHVLKSPLRARATCSARSARRLLVRRHLLPLGVPAGVHARLAEHLAPAARLRDRLRADAGARCRSAARVRSRRCCRSRSPGAGSRSPPPSSRSSPTASSTSGCRSSPPRSGCAGCARPSPA